MQGLVLQDSCRIELSSSRVGSLQSQTWLKQLAMPPPPFKVARNWVTAVPFAGQRPPDVPQL